MQPRWRLALLLHLDGERAVKPSARAAITAASSRLRIFSCGACRIRNFPPVARAVATTSK